MKYIFILPFTLILSASITGQELLDKAFSNLVNSTWVCDTTWNNGQKFHQEITYSFDLNKNIVQAETVGHLDASGKRIGKRNHGIRYRSDHPDTLNFIEFDVFGGVTKGVCFMIETDLFYQYEYEIDLGTSTMTECYRPIDENTFEYTLGIFENGEWTFEYISSYFRKQESK